MNANESISTNLGEYLERVNPEYGVPQYVIDAAAAGHKGSVDLVVVIDWKRRTIDFQTRGANYKKDEPFYYVDFDNLNHAVFHISRKRWVSNGLLACFGEAVSMVQGNREPKHWVEEVSDATHHVIRTRCIAKLDIKQD